MNRRSFLKTTFIGGLAVGTGFCTYLKDKTRILTLSFDDGFRKSFLKIADIYEDYGLKACLNVIASGRLPTFLVNLLKRLVKVDYLEIMPTGEVLKRTNNVTML